MNEKTTYERTMKTKNYSRIDNGIAKLPLIEGGIMGRILSNSDDYIVHKHQIQKNSGVPRNKFESAWKNLIEKGYIIPQRIKGGYKYTIVESPQVPNTVCVDSTNTTGSSCTSGTLITTNKKTTNIPDLQDTGASFQINLKNSAGEPARQDVIKHPEENFKWEKTQLERKISKIKILQREVLELPCMRIYKKEFPNIEADFLLYGSRMFRCAISDFDKKVVQPKILKIMSCSKQIEELIEKIYEEEIKKAE